MLFYIVDDYFRVILRGSGEVLFDYINVNFISVSIKLRKIMVKKIFLIMNDIKLIVY